MAAIHAHLSYELICFSQFFCNEAFTATRQASQTAEVKKDRVDFVLQAIKSAAPETPDLAIKHAAPSVRPQREGPEATAQCAQAAVN